MNSEPTTPTSLPHINADGAALVYDLAAQVGFDITVQTEPEPRRYGPGHRLHTLPGRNTEIILFAGNAETELDTPHAQAREVLYVLEQFVTREYGQQIRSRTYRDGTPITWIERTASQIADAAEALRGHRHRVSELAIKRAEDLLVGLHLLARDQDKDLRGIEKAVPAVLAWAIERTRHYEYLEFEATEVIRHRVPLSFAELDRRLPGWEDYLQGRVDAADAPSWDRALAQYVSEWKGSDDSLTIGQHLVVDDCKIRDLDRDDDEPYWIPFYT